VTNEKSIHEVSAAQAKQALKKYHYLVSQSWRTVTGCGFLSTCWERQDRMLWVISRQNMDLRSSPLRAYYARSFRWSFLRRAERAAAPEIGSD